MKGSGAFENDNCGRQGLEDTGKSTYWRADPKAKETENMRRCRTGRINPGGPPRKLRESQRMKKREKAVKEMTREHFLLVNDTARSPQPGVEAEKGSCRRPSTRKKEDAPKRLQRGKHQTREKGRGGKAAAFATALHAGGQRSQAAKKVSNLELSSHPNVSWVFSDTQS